MTTPGPRRDIEDRFINEWGLLANAWGVSPLLGRIHGLLLLVGRPMTAEEVCERLERLEARLEPVLQSVQGGVMFLAKPGGVLRSLGSEPLADGVDQRPQRLELSPRFRR